ncbi:MAG TPA: ornithine cyclodeaminase family protein [Actinomycetota bacterium]|nr:ornithine cyclodeaminase family protein [Actinomycetota bacterium]
MTPTTLYLDRASVERVGLPMEKIIEVVEAALVEKAHGRVQMPAKHWMEPRPTRWFGGMSSLIPSLGYAAMKWQSGSSENAAHGLPYLTGMLFLNDLETGLVRAVMDSTWLTQQRTAAESAVAVKHLARPGATRFSILGCGVQARSHLEAFRRVMPKLAEVVCFDIDQDAAARYAEVVREAGLEATIVDGARAAVEAGDVVVTAGPIEVDQPRTIEPGWLKPGALGVTLDYDCYWKPEAFAAADLLFTDDLGQIEHIKESGYFVGAPAPDGELGAIAAGLHPGRSDESQTIITMNMGVAVEDVAVAKEIYEAARERGIGTELPL